MRHLYLLDHAARFVFLSSTSAGTSPGDFLGGYPWEFVLDEQVDQVRAEVLTVFAPGVTFHRFGLLWINPSEPAMRYFYFQESRWIGLAEVAVATEVWEFPSDLGRLSPREHETLGLLGCGRGVKSAARIMQVSVNTVHSFMRSLREKLDLDSAEQLVAFASRYRDALTGPDGWW
ncbi:MAG: response regulator transcription factor [Mycobacterium sp.]